MKRKLLLILGVILLFAVGMVGCGDAYTGVGTIDDSQTSLTDIESDTQQAAVSSAEMTDIYLDPIAVDPRDIKMLQDLIVAAHNKARTDLADKLKEKMGPLSGKFNFPGFN